MVRPTEGEPEWEWRWQIGHRRVAPPVREILEQILDTPRANDNYAQLDSRSGQASIGLDGRACQSMVTMGLSVLNTSEYPNRQSLVVLTGCINRLVLRYASAWEVLHSPKSIPNHCTEAERVQHRRQKIWLNKGYAAKLQYTGFGEEFESTKGKLTYYFIMNPLQSWFTMQHLD